MHISKWHVDEGLNDDQSGHYYSATWELINNKVISFRPNDWLFFPMENDQALNKCLFIFNQTSTNHQYIMHQSISFHFLKTMDYILMYV